MIAEHFENVIFAPQVKYEVEEFLFDVEVFHEMLDGTRLLIEYELSENDSIETQRIYATSMRINSEGDRKILGMKILSISGEG